MGGGGKDHSSQLHTGGHFPGQFQVCPCGIVGSQLVLLVASSMSAFILDVIASFLHSGGNGNIHICWISSGRGILEVCQHGKKHIWQVKHCLVSSWPFFRAAFLVTFLGLPASALLLLFHRNIRVLIGVGVFYSDCVNTHAGFWITNPLGLEKVPILSFRGRCSKAFTHLCVIKNQPGRTLQPSVLRDPGEVETGRRDVSKQRQKIQFSRPNIC